VTGTIPGEATLVADARGRSLPSGRELGDVLPIELAATSDPSEQFCEALAKEFCCLPGGTPGATRASSRSANRFSTADLLSMADYFSASFQAMTLRLEELELLPQGPTRSSRPVDFDPPPREVRKPSPLRSRRAGCLLDMSGWHSRPTRTRTSPRRSSRASSGATGLPRATSISAGEPNRTTPADSSSTSGRISNPARRVAHGRYTGGRRRLLVDQPLRDRARRRDPAGVRPSAHRPSGGPRRGAVPPGRAGRGRGTNALAHRLACPPRLRARDAGALPDDALALSSSSRPT